MSDETNQEKPLSRGSIEMAIECSYGGRLRELGLTVELKPAEQEAAEDRAAKVDRIQADVRARQEARPQDAFAARREALRSRPY